MQKKRIYMDYAAGVDNPSSIHKDGVRAARELALARGRVADFLSAHADEIVFAASGTESDNLAVMGVFKHARLSKEFAGRDVHIITTAIEHPAVLEACRHLESVGAKVTYLSVNAQGLIDCKELRAALRPETVLVSVAYANNEIGVIEPLREIAKEIRHFKKLQAESGKQNAVPYPLFHTDACQAAAYLSMNVAELGVDLLTFNSTKLGGPAGIGVLFVRRDAPIDPIIYGGGQEHGLRSGTENVPAAAGLMKALLARPNPEMKELQDFFIAEIKKRFPQARINGSLEHRLPNNINVSFPNMESELLVLELDARGISVSAGSACAGAKDQSSHVLEALYGKDDAASTLLGAGKKWGTVRFSLGRTTKKRDCDRALRALEEIFKKYERWV